MASRSNLIIVIDNLLPDQLANFGQHIKNLPIPPIVTLVSTIPILNNEQSEEKQLQAKYDLAIAKEMLHFPAASEIVPGSNPRNAEIFFRESASDAMIRSLNGRPTITVKNFEAPGIQELADSIPLLVIDVSEHKAFQHSYKGVFAKPCQANVTAERQPVMSDLSKPKV